MLRYFLKPEHSNILDLVQDKWHNKRSERKFKHGKE